MSQMQSSQSIGKYNLNSTLFNSGTPVFLISDSDTQRKFAAKVAKSSSKKASLQREAHIIQKLNRALIPYLVRIHDYIENEEPPFIHSEFLEPSSPRRNSSFDYRACLVTEYVPNGTLLQYLCRFGALDEKLARTYFIQLMTTISSLHQKGYCHGDLKPDNILLDAYYKFKICDFGCTRQFDPENEQEMTGKYGTESYLAPEILFGKAYYGSKTDVFSLGIILFMMITGRPPFLKAEYKDVMYRWLIAETPEKLWECFEAKINNGNEYNNDLKELINAMLSHKSINRPSTSKILEFDWMKGDTYSDEELIKIMSEKRSS